jgi:transcriptional regulator with XRE-family HTH domain
MTQTELGDAAGVSQRVVAYYESESAQPPGSLLVDFAKALKVSTDELLGVKPIAEKLPPKTARLLKRLRRIEELPAADQRADSTSSTRCSRRDDAPPRRRGKGPADLTGLYSPLVPSEGPSRSRLPIDSGD